MLAETVTLVVTVLAVTLLVVGTAVLVCLLLKKGAVMSETDPQIRRLDSCIELLEYFERLLQVSLNRGEQSDDPPAVMLCRAFAFGRTTLEAMIATARTGTAHWVCAPILCRAFYEVAHKLLWASREHNGWQRMQFGAADEHRKWANAATKIPSVATHAEKVLGSMQMILARTDEAGEPYTKPPKMEQILREIEEQDVRYGMVSGPSDLPKFLYTNLWRIMSNSVHGHLVQVAGDPNSHLQIGVSAAISATFGLLRATAVVVSPADDYRQTVDTIGQRIVEVLKGDFDLKLDEVTFTFEDGSIVE